MIYDLRSDTFTTPCAQMRKVMAEAETGDACYGEDPIINELEEFCAEYFAKEAALFMPTGTMSNQVAIKTQTRPGDEILTHQRYHVYYYEAAATSSLSASNFHCIGQESGFISPRDIQEGLDAKPRGQLYGRTRLLVLENSVCSLAGKAFSSEQLLMSCQFARSNNLHIHLDGARLLNACVATGSCPQNFAKLTDSLSVCFAKGLGAPMGSILLGRRSFIEEAKIYRKWFGGALHQGGVVAAACLYGIREIGMQQLLRDHQLARRVHFLLTQHVDPESLCYPGTNMILLDTAQLGIPQQGFIEVLAQHKVYVLPWDKNKVRLVFHRDIAVESAEIIAHKVMETVGSLACDTERSQPLQAIVNS